MIKSYKKMRIILLVFALTSCSPGDTEVQKACIPPPNGEVVEGGYNISFVQGILVYTGEVSEFKATLKDIVLVYKNSELELKRDNPSLYFSDWQQVPSFNFIGVRVITNDNEVYTYNLSFEDGANSIIASTDRLLMGFTLNSDNTLLVSFSDSECNDVIDFTF